jgi:serine/threonine protein kinase
MGAVFKARHRLMERWVALKVMSPTLLHRPAAVERFQREVKAAAPLTHANIVTAHDAEQAGRSHFLVMEFVEGISLDRLVDEGAPRPVAVACGYARQAALGVYPLPPAGRPAAVRGHR